MLISNLEGTQKKKNMKADHQIRASVGRESPMGSRGVNRRAQQGLTFLFLLFFLWVFPGNWKETDFDGLSKKDIWKFSSQVVHTVSVGMEGGLTTLGRYRAFLMKLSL